MEPRDYSDRADLAGLLLAVASDRAIRRAIAVARKSGLQIRRGYRLGAVTVSPLQNTLWQATEPQHRELVRALALEVTPDHLQDPEGYARYRAVAAVSDRVSRNDSTAIAEAVAAAVADRDHPINSLTTADGELLDEFDFDPAADPALKARAAIAIADMADKLFS